MVSKKNGKLQSLLNLLEKGSWGFYKARLDHQVDLCSAQHLCIAGRKVSAMAPWAHCSLAPELGRGWGRGLSFPLLSEGGESKRDSEILGCPMECGYHMWYWDHSSDFW